MWPVNVTQRNFLLFCPLRWCPGYFLLLLTDLKCVCVCLCVYLGILPENKLYLLLYVSIHINCFVKSRPSSQSSSIKRGLLNLSGLTAARLPLQAQTVTGCVCIVYIFPLGIHRATWQDQLIKRRQKVKCNVKPGLHSNSLKVHA